MDLNFTTIYNNINKIIKGPIIDLSVIDSIDPWSLAMFCLLLVERFKDDNKQIILPKNKNLLKYLKEMSFDKVLEELNYNEQANILQRRQISESENLNIQAIKHCYFRDEIDVVINKLINVFKNFSLNIDDSIRTAHLIGEVGNNVFDHNSLVWPTDISGCFIIIQNYPKTKKVEVVVSDPGIGFFGSLRNAYPELETSLEAIKKGLTGFTGRVGEERGNGLRLIQNWTKIYFSGKIMIHSGSGLVVVKEDKMEEFEVNKILGTIVQLVLYYK